MKKWKKSLAALLSAAMLLGLLAACVAVQVLERQAVHLDQLHAAVRGVAQGRAALVGHLHPVDISTNPRTMDIFPENLALAATFNTDLAAEVSKELAKEYRALGVITLLGPQIDLSTEPRWRRISGAYGEDPALSRDMTPCPRRRPGWSCSSPPGSWRGRRCQSSERCACPRPGRP